LSGEVEKNRRKKWYKKILKTLLKKEKPTTNSENKTKCQAPCK